MDLKLAFLGFLLREETKDVRGNQIPGAGCVERVDRDREGMI